MAKVAQEMISQSAYRRASSYFGESLGELKKVQPPSRQETRLQTLVVLGLIAMFSAVLAVMDGLFNVVMSWIV
jgi:preprotein translocase SecE subunit